MEMETGRQQCCLVEEAEGRRNCSVTVSQWSVVMRGNNKLETAL